MRDTLPVMGHTETEADLSLRPDHAGIIAWRYNGRRVWLSSFFTGPSEDNVSFFVNGEQRMDETLHSIGMAAGSAAVTETTIYNDQLLESLARRHDPSACTLRWSAIVLERDMMTLPSTLATAQQIAHQRAQGVANTFREEITSAQGEGIIHPGDDVRDSVMHTLSHLHTIGPQQTSADGQGYVPIQGLWLPNTELHK